ncbi:MAG: hypothetical protein F6K16_28590, partial [Symploca sp. SIO2B6]|nr:hypothetical protein [Symploca sp. SIO2B6]
MNFPPLIDLQNSLKMGVPDAELIQSVLNHPSPYVQYEAYQLLRSRSHPTIDKTFKHYRFWQHFERLDGLPVKHAQIFANRPVVEVLSLLSDQETDGLDCHSLNIGATESISY